VSDFDARRRAATHESIHLVLDWRLGLVITMATIDPALAAKVGGPGCYGLVRGEQTGPQMLRDPMESLSDLATGTIGANFAAGSTWSPGDWDVARAYADKAWQRAGRGSEGPWKGRWLNDARKRAGSILRESKSVRAANAVGAVLYEWETLDGGKAVEIMESA
jgi:hypothetical protein